MAQANLNSGIYTGTDGFGGATVDQEPGVTSYAGTLGTIALNDGANDVQFVRLGTVNVTDGTFSLTVADDPADGDFIFADAAAIRMIPEPSTSLLGLVGLGWPHSAGGARTADVDRRVKVVARRGWAIFSLALWACVAGCDRPGDGAATLESPEPSPLLPATVPVVDAGIVDTAPGDDWEVEQFSEAAGDALARIFAGDVTSAGERWGAMRPDLERVSETGRITTWRRAGPGKAGSPEESITHLSAPYRGGAPERLKKKVVSAVVHEDGMVDATLWYESFGPREGGGLLQQRARWKTRWRWDGGERPVLAELETPYFEGGSAGVGRADVRGSHCGVCSAAAQPGGINSRWARTIGCSVWSEFHGSFLGTRCGIAVADFDGDGRDDVYLPQPSGVPNRLLLHTSGGLRDASVEAGLDWLDFTSSALAVDLDNDGDQDLALATNIGVLVLEQVAPLRFERRATLRAEDSDVESLCAADFDADGDLDLYICFDYADSGARRGEARGSSILHDSNDGGANRLFENRLAQDGGIAFRDVTVAVGLDRANRRHSNAAAWADYDLDGDLDLYVANDYGKNCLYRNDAAPDADSGRRFVEVAASSGAQDIGPGMSADWSDYDNDGDLDLYVGNMFSSAGGRIHLQANFRSWLDEESRSLYRRFVKGNSLFENLGDGTFREVGDPLGVEPGRWAWSSVFADLNSDGWDDAVVANGYITTADTGDL